MAEEVKTKRRGMEVDRISKMPDAVVCHIMSFLPKEEAVNTSILSKRWKYLFASLTNLHFDYSSFSKTLNKGRRRRSSTSSSSNIISFISLVDRVLFLRISSSIHSFYVNFREAIDLFRVTAWINTALLRNVQEIDLLVCLRESSVLPGDLCTSKTLVVLKLKFDPVPSLHGLDLVTMLNVPAKVCLPSLKHLHLDNVTFADDNSIARLISSCPVLEDLTLYCDWDNICKLSISSCSLKRFTVRTCCFYAALDEILVHAPSLVYLDYADYLPVSCSLTNLDSLVEARIGFEKFSDNNASITQFFKRISHVQSLKLSFEVMEAIQMCHHPLPVLGKLTHLEIRADVHTVALGLPHLLERCSNLEYLVFNGVGLFRGLVHSGDWNPPDVVPSCLLFHLKEIEINFSWWEKELEFVKYCLQNGRVLMKLTIHAYTDEVDQLKIAKQLLMLPKGTRECQVIII
ncbi:F-box domain-containing protein/LRR_2 domain-containing protein/FBD domain-containing protein [Cephalotus follicularis]|uniref:F-box domain-containing protein/LRR_2 domain-containing protein/FBD domain-containing protein n=1 Tax=Cephalotus follicularis TaxID=3775 RepID=A0A1Q3AYM7_CEPFO|nr:F-box domain-containing protein/LRR_2 domain-containing protein/FBD domain-containing protein [Cephalotus follicularis]